MRIIRYHSSVHTFEPEFATPPSVSGWERCVLLVNPEDAARAGIHADGEAPLESRVHTGPVAVKLTDEIRAGVVSLPHGWGHAPAAPWQKVAGAHPGVSANDWTDSTVVESVVGQSVLNEVPVRLRPSRMLRTWNPPTIRLRCHRICHRITADDQS